MKYVFKCGLKLLMTCMAVPVDIRKENPNAHNLGELAYLLGSWQSVH